MSKTRAHNIVALPRQTLYRGNRHAKQKASVHPRTWFKARQNELERLSQPPSLDKARFSVHQALGDFVSKPISISDIVDSFSEPTNKNYVLRGIDQIWESDFIFTSDNEELETYGKILTHIADSNSKFLSVSLGGYSNSDFPLEVKKLARNDNFDPKTKAIVLTQALELALRGVHVTPVLKNINNAKYLTESSGYRQELLASWFLVKFILPDYSDTPYQIKHSVIVDLHGKSGKKEQEIDLQTPKRLVEVKQHAEINDNQNDFADELAKLFNTVIYSNGDYKLKNNIRHLVFVAGTDDLALCSRHWDKSLIERKAVVLAKGKLRGLNSSDEKIRNRLLNASCVSLYNVPYVTGHKLIRDWVKLLYYNEYK